MDRDARKREQIAAISHGIRSSVRDRTPEAVDHSREVVEAALAPPNESQLRP